MRLDRIDRTRKLGLNFYISSLTVDGVKTVTLDDYIANNASAFNGEYEDEPELKTTYRWLAEDFDEILDALEWLVIARNIEEAHIIGTSYIWNQELGCVLDEYDDEDFEEFVENGNTWDYVWKGGVKNEK